MARSLLKDDRDPWFWCDNRLLDAGLSVRAIGVYCVLARYADKSRRSFPGIRRIARTLQIGSASVLRAIDELVEGGLVKKTPRFDPSGDRTSHLYRLLSIRAGGRSATETPVPLEKQGVPPQKHGCLIHPEELLWAKIAAWWDHPLPRTFRGNRTFPAFLQWFDDIALNGDAPPPGRVVSPDECRAALREGSPAGRKYYREIVGDITDANAKIRTLIAEGVADDSPDARAIIAACDPTGH
ncbi:MAG: helix-turn-helix domain-containing protein [candidate division Zixibacteria bacterium]|nr:helix-turn-helix domain-containing protein [candidate division Zixibacteria bacterium]